MLVCRVSAYSLYCYILHERQWSHEACSLRFLYTAMNEFTAGHLKKKDTQKRNHVHTRTHSHIYALTHTHTQKRAPIETVLALANEGRATAPWEAEAGRWLEGVSCSQREIAGHHCCCWEGRGGPGRTAARPGWSAQEEAKDKWKFSLKSEIRFS